MNIFHKVLELWPGHESGTDRRTDGRTDGRDGTGRTGVTLNALRLFFEYAARLASKYRWREFPVVITGNYRPGKYSKFWLSGKYWEIQNFRAV